MVTENATVSELTKRIAQLEYKMSRIKTDAFAPRSVETNPIDDPDGTDWSGHPWSVLVDDDTTEDVVSGG